jgi:hypothetical protein
MIHQPKKKRRFRLDEPKPEKKSGGMAQWEPITKGRLSDMATGTADQYWRIDLDRSDSTSNYYFTWTSGTAENF